MENSRQVSDKQKEYWKKNIALIRNLLIVWAGVSYVPGVLFAKALSKIYFFSVPLSFWFAQQGSILIFVCIIFYYSWKMDRLDQEYNVEEVKVMDKNKGVSV